MLKKKGSILRVILKKSLSHIEKSSVNCIVFLRKAQFFESFFFFFFEKTEKFNSLSRTQKKNNSLSHAQEISIL